MSGMLEAIEGFWLAEYLRRAVIAYPAVNAAHILFLGALVTSAILMDLRILGLGTRIAIADAVGHLRIVAIFALIGAVTTGALLFSVQPQTYAANPVFVAKLILVALALVNAGTFTFAARHETPKALLTRLMALASIVLWLTAVFAGRAIAFFD